MSNNKRRLMKIRRAQENGADNNNLESPEGNFRLKPF